MAHIRRLQAPVHLTAAGYAAIAARLADELDTAHVVHRWSATTAAPSRRSRGRAGQREHRWWPTATLTGPTIAAREDVDVEYPEGTDVDPDQAKKKNKKNHIVIR